MASTLKIMNVPAYISEGEFKRIWSQPGLDCQSCTFTKAPSGETIGYAQFANPQAAGRARGMYQGWQGYGNPDGLRIDFVVEEQPMQPMRMKRDREDVGGEDQAFKQGRLMQGTNMGFAGGVGLGNFNSMGMQQRPHENHGFPNPTANQAPNQPLMGNNAMAQPAAQQPSNNLAFPGTQGPRPSFMPQASQGFVGQPPQQPSSGAPNPQGYTAGGSMGFNATSQGYNPAPSHRGMPAQPSYGSQEGSSSLSQNAQYGVPAQAAQQPPKGPQHSPLVQPGAQYTSSNGPTYQMGYGNPSYPTESLTAAHTYDPQNPQLSVNQQASQQQQQQQQQQQPPLQAQPYPQQMASLANVLGPLLQQPGMQSLSNINLGSLLSQGLGGNTPQQQPAPGPGQQQAMPQPQQQPLQGMMAPPLQQQQVPPGHIPRQEALAPPQQVEPLPAEAAETLYVDNMTMDVTKREMSHVFRPFEGFKDMRIVEKKDKHGSPLVIGFAEFENAHQGYALDMTKPTENLLRISFAKPLKASDPRSRGPAVNRAYNPPSIGGNRPNERAGAMRADRGQGPANPTARGDRRDRDRAPNRGVGVPDRSDRRPGHEERRPTADNRRRY